MIEILYLSPVWNDLEEIQSWYKKKMGIDSARKIRDSIMKEIDMLKDFPMMGAPIPDKWLSELGYRMLVINKHVAIYRVEDNTIIVYYIADSRTNYLRTFILSGRVLHEDTFDYDFF